MARRLTEAAQADRDDFERLYRFGGCSCHINAPCGCCTHPGNPICQEEDECWEEDVEECRCVSLLNGHEFGCPYHR